MLSRPAPGQRNWSQNDNSKGFAEKRRHERLTISIEGAILHGNATIPVKMVDLSKSGALLRLAEEPLSIPRIGNLVELSLAWPMDSTTGKLRVEAEVVRVRDDTIAVAFTHVKQDHTFH